jgi:hypothetical protein
MTPEALKFLNPDTRVFDTLDWIAARRSKRVEPPIFCTELWGAAFAKLVTPCSYTLAELRAKVECDADAAPSFSDTLDD